MRNFDDIIEATREDLKESEALILRLNKKPLSEEDINHYAKVFGFDSDDAATALTLRIRISGSWLESPARLTSRQERKSISRTSTSTLMRKATCPGKYWPPKE